MPAMDDHASVSTASSAPAATVTVTPGERSVVFARIWHLVVALLGTGSLVIGLTLAATEDGNGGAINGLVFSLSYFTVLSNILVAVVTWSLVVRPDNDGRVFRWLRLTSLVMIVITGLVYALVLAADADPTGWYVWSNLGYHYLVPWLSLAGFLLFGPRPRITWDLVPKMLIIPVIWLTYTLIHGAFLTTPPGYPAAEPLPPQHWYPYPFLDVGDPAALIPGMSIPGGYAGVMINIVLIIILGLLFAMAFLGLDRLLSRGQQPTPLTGDDSGQADEPATAG